MAATYLTIEEFAGEDGYLHQLDITEPSVETKALAVLERAESIVDGILGYHYEAYANGQKTVRAQRGEYFTLPAHDIGSVTAVTDMYDVTLDEWQELENGMLLFTNAYGYLGNWGGAFWKVTADWGYGPVPPDVKEVTLEIAVNIWQSAEAGKFTDVVGASDGGAAGYEKELTAQQRMILKNAIRANTPLAI